MASVAQADSRRMYSWWWDSHISPKNSKWLQENLTDMDAKVKQMIKLIEEDADSFARRAEMYYKKRPELMKLVEEFYRAYSALADRYDHATGALCQAHRTMSEAFPNHVPFILGDDSPAGSVPDADPHTPEMALACAFVDPDELQNGSLGLSASHLHALKKNRAFTDESDSVTSRRDLKQLNDIFGPGEAVDHTKFGEGQARKGLNFYDSEEKEQAQNNGSHDIKARVPSESERVGKAEMEILNVKNALAKLEAEKEAGLLQYQQSQGRLSNLEFEVSRAQEHSKGLSEQARKSEAEVATLQEALTRLEAEKEANLLQYQQCLDKISNMEKNISCAEADAGQLSDRASKAENEAHSLKQDLARIAVEKEAAVVKYEEFLKMISDLENKLLHAKEDAKRINKLANKAESEVESVKQAIAKLTEEKEALALQYQQCQETIYILEHKLALTEEEAQRLNSELDNEVVKLNGSEEMCVLLERSNQTLHSELESMVQKLGSQSQEITEKQKELGRLWTCIQEERLRFMEAETAFQTLQHLYSQSQEELRSLAAELQNRAQILKDMETHNQFLQEQVKKVEEENKRLNELNLSSAVSVKNLQDEILSLREIIGKLEAEVELRVDQRNALQQEIYCLKEELNELNKKHQAMMDQVESVCLNPENFELSVKELQDENSKLNEVCEKDRCEKEALIEKLKIMEKLLEKNTLLENSLSDLTVELEGVRERVNNLEEACQNLLNEKSMLVAEKDTLISQLQDVTGNFDKLSQKNTFLENSLSDANAELEVLRVKSKNLEDSCLFLDNEKSCLMTERESLVSQLDIARKGLEGLEKSYAKLEENYLGLEKEKEFALRKVEGLQVSFDSEKQTHANFVQLSEIRFACMESQICFLQEEGQCRKKAYEEELDKALTAQIEIFVMQKCIQDLKEKNFSILFERQGLLQTSNLSEKLICELEHQNLEQQEEVKSLVSQIKALRVGLYQLLETLEIDADLVCDSKMEQDQTLLNHISGKLEKMQISLLSALDENQQFVVENSVLVALLGQLKLEAENLATERNTFDEEFRRQILKLSEDYDCQIEEIKCIHEANVKFESELWKLHRELEETKHREASLNQELEKGRNETELWETQAVKFFSELQITSVCEVFLEEKAHELARMCQNLKGRSNSKDKEIDQLKERVSTLEGENGGLKAQLAASIPAVISLRDCIRSLENHTFSHKADNEEAKDAQLVSHLQAASCRQTIEDQIGTIPDGFTDLQDLQMRIQAIEKAVIEKERLAMLETLNANTKLEAAVRQIEELKYRSNLHQESGRKSKHVRKHEQQDLGDGLTDNLKQQKPTPEISEERNEVMTKDIMLDQVSECSSYGISRRGTMEADDQMLELWETADKGSIIDLRVGKSQKVAGAPADYHQIKALKQQESKNPFIESLVGEELGVDKLEISKRFSESQKEGSKRKILERLDSDAQKLTNLQITVQGLKRKVEDSDKGIKGKGIEFDTVKQQLEEAEEAILILLDVNRKLITNSEDISSFEGNSAIESDDSGSVRRQRISEQAQRGSEKIGRLQLEVHKLQFLLLKLDDEKESRGRTRITERKTRGLRDFVYGGTRTNHKRKKAHFCACLPLPTKGD